MHIIYLHIYIYIYMCIIYTYAYPSNFVNTFENESTCSSSKMSPVSLYVPFLYRCKARQDSLLTWNASVCVCVCEGVCV